MIDAEVKDVLRGYSLELEAAGRSKGTISIRTSHARRVCEWVNKPLKDITRDDLIAWLAQGNWQADARASARTSVKQFFSWLTITGRIDADPAASLPTIRRPRAVPKPIPDAYIAQALAAPNIDPRARLAIEIMATCGLRRAEVASIRAKDVEPVGQGWQLRVTGKGGHTRLVPCPPMLARRITAAGGWLFPGDVDGHISPGWLGKLISRAIHHGYTPHKLRHRFASVAYGHTHDLRSVQELLGHSSLATTQVYVGVDTDARVETAQTAWAIAS